MIYKRNNEIDILKWNDLVHSNRCASPFQTPEFYHMISNLPGFASEVFAVLNKGQIQVLMLVVIQYELGIKSIFSRRGIVYGGPLIRDENKSALDHLLILVNRVMSKKVIYLEVRNYFEYKYFKEVYVNRGYSYIPYLNLQINIDGKSIDEVLQQMKYNRRREIKMSLKHDLTFEETTNEDEVLALYQILEELYKKKVKLPLPDFSFFRTFIASDIAKTFIVKHDNKIIAGSFCLYLPSKNLFTMYYCGLRASNRKIFPTHIAIYAAITYALKENISIIDLMGAGKPDEEYGVRDFKTQFGGELVEHGRFVNVLNPFRYWIGKAGLKLSAKLNK